MTYAQTADKAPAAHPRHEDRHHRLPHDAPPFRVPGGGQPAGYTVELCKRIAASLEQQLSPSLSVKWVSRQRAEPARRCPQGEADMECGTTTATLGAHGAGGFF